MLASELLNRLENLIHSQRKRIDRDVDWCPHQTDIHPHQFCFDSSHSRQKVVGRLDHDGNKTLLLYRSRKNPLLSARAPR
jgi:hypothetical protein